MNLLRKAAAISSRVMTTLNSAAIEYSTHTERTSGSYRSELFHQAVVSDINQLSPTVKEYSLIIKETTPTFKAGQWLDVQIPDQDGGMVGGYSLTCSPNQFDQCSRQLTLAIQYSEHPPTHWMHRNCQVGSDLKIRVGGDFFYDPALSSPLNLLLVAGGIGINPIYSIFRHQYDLLLKDPPLSFPRTFLLYSAQNRSELIFKDDIFECCRAFPNNLTSNFFVTRENCSQDNYSEIEEHRIRPDDLAQAMKLLPLDKTHAYICGPPPFINDIVENLNTLGLLDEKRIHFEKWW